jgi:predicted O-methyltransferase YrrM
MSQTIWSQVDAYFTERFSLTNEALNFALENSAAHSLPPIQVSPSQGQFLYILAKAIAAKRVLEIGTLGGYSTIWLARALAEDGEIITVEGDARHAQVALMNFQTAGLADRITLIQDDGQTALKNLVAQGVGSFDLIFIDADKPGYPVYLEYALKLSRPGTLIVGDNVVRRGEITNPDSVDPNVVGVQQFCDALASKEATRSTAIQTVGIKGHDGFTLTLVQGQMG